MQAQGAQGISLLWVIGFCVAAWLSGAVFGYGVREIRQYIGENRWRMEPRRLEPLPLPGRAPAETPRRRRTSRRQRRGGGYYFSEEARGWGDGRWRRRAGWATVGLIVVLLGGSTLFAASNYKPTRLPAPGLRH